MKLSKHYVKDGKAVSEVVKIGNIWLDRKIFTKNKKSYTNVLTPYNSYHSDYTMLPLLGNMKDLETRIVPIGKLDKDVQIRILKVIQDKNYYKIIDIKGTLETQYKTSLIYKQNIVITDVLYTIQKVTTFKVIAILLISQN